MDKEFTQLQKDELLRKHLLTLASRGIARRWAATEQPFSALLQECRLLMSEKSSLEEFRNYLQAHPIIQQSVEMLLSYMAIACNAKWQEVPANMQPLAWRGWHITRWLPIFLVIDGPLGRFLTNSSSPLNIVLKKEFTKYPTLTQARDIFNHELFKQMRNGLGHWSFLWEEQGDTPRLIMIDWKSGSPTTTITLLEGEALHLVAFSVIEMLDREIMARVNPIYESPDLHT